MKKILAIILVLALAGYASATVTNWGGNTFTGLNADVKPTNVPDGSRFFEIDTPFGVYVRSSSTWTLVSGVTITFDHNDMTGLNVGDYLHMTAAQNSKLDGIETGAEVNVNADWNSESGDSQMLNKPTIPADVSGAHYVTTQAEGGLSAEAVIPTCTGTDKLTFDGSALSCDTDATGSSGVRVTSVASAAPPTPNADTTDQYNLTAQAEAAAFAVPSGTPSDGQKLIIRIKDNGTARGVSFNAIKF